MSKFRMAYIILCHKNPKQINLMLEYLNHDCIDFFIHIDKKKEFQNNIIKRENIYIIDNPVRVIWGDYSQIASTIKCFKAVREKAQYDYVHVISGQDMPLMNSDSISDFFKKNNGKEFLAHIEIEDKNRQRDLFERLLVFYPLFLIKRGKYISYLRRIYVEVVMLIPFIQRNIECLPPKLYKGSNWMSITGECMDFILEYIKENPKYDNFFQNTLCGDEVYFHSIIMNSKYKDNVINDNKRYIDWQTGPDRPRTLSDVDLPKIYQAGNVNLWARKLDIKHDFSIFKEIIEKIESKPNNKSK